MPTGVTTHTHTHTHSHTHYTKNKLDINLVFWQKVFQVEESDVRLVML